MSIPLVYGAYAAGAGLLAAGGVAKALRPAGTARALRQLRLPAVLSNPIAVRSGGVAEVAVGATALVSRGPTEAAAAVAVVLSYLLFAVVVVAAYRRGSPLSSCGCFGEVEAPPTPAHVVVNLFFAAGAAAVAAGRHPSMIGLVRARPLDGAVFVGLTGTVAYLAYLVMAVLPRLSGFTAVPQ